MCVCVCVSHPQCTTHAIPCKCRVIGDTKRAITSLPRLANCGEISAANCETMRAHSSSPSLPLSPPTRLIRSRFNRCTHIISYPSSAFGYMLLFQNTPHKYT